MSPRDRGRSSPSYRSAAIGRKRSSPSRCSGASARSPGRHAAEQTPSSCSLKRAPPRPVRLPVLWITVAFGLGLWAGLAGSWAWGVGAPVLLGALVLWRRAPVGAACGVMFIAGVLWGGAALRERAATCAGTWAREREARTHAALVRLADPVAAAGGIVEGGVGAPSCGGVMRVRWPEGRAARGGTTWVVAGRWLGDADRGVLVARRVRMLDATPHGRGALRDRIAARSARLFGKRAPLVDALVIARTAELDPELRERYSRSGLAHILSISGLHVGFIAAWLGVLLRALGLGPRNRFVAATTLIAAYC